MAPGPLFKFHFGNDLWGLIPTMVFVVYINIKFGQWQLMAMVIVDTKYRQFLVVQMGWNKGQ